MPPPWGLTPGPAKANPDGGWDLSNNAPDIYVFLPHGDYCQLRKDFLKLTGPTEMPPLFMFGAFDSRWYDYSEATALKQIDDYRAHKIPLDVLVVDTGWRAGRFHRLSAEHESVSRPAAVFSGSARQKCPRVCSTTIPNR